MRTTTRLQWSTMLLKAPWFGPNRNCWLRRRRHTWMMTGAFSFVGRGSVLRCKVCKHEIATSEPGILARAERRRRA